MDIQIDINNDVIRGIVTSMLLAVVGGFFVLIIQSAREGVTFWLFKHFPNNRGKLYVMATSRGGSYLDVLGLFNLLGGAPIFAVLFLMTIGILGHAFSGLVVGTKIIRKDLCTNNGCFSTGIGQTLLQANDKLGDLLPASQVMSMNNFMLQPFNNTITLGLPWEGNRVRVVTAANFPPEIYQVPLERLNSSMEYTGIYNDVVITAAELGLEYMDGTFAHLTPGVATTSNTSTVIDDDGWTIYDSTTIAPVFAGAKVKGFYLSTGSVTGINLLLMSSLANGFGDNQWRQEASHHIQLNDTSSSIRRATYYGHFQYRCHLVAMNVTLKSRSDGNINQLEFSTFKDIRPVRRVDVDEFFNATLSNLNGNSKVLSNYSRELQSMSRDPAHALISTAHNGDLISYIATCYTMAASQTQPNGMVKGYEQAGIITPVISIKLALAIPLLLVTIALLVPYAIVTIKLYKNDGKWLPYKIHVDTREYIINLCHSRFVVSKPIGDAEALKIIREDHGEDGPIFELEKLSM
ncbi:hypothetical protein BGX28_009278 [Mortierella sp. GBA30]|nr:hypothetical protein BGX28_009278 [Mortierella sp. GBA30]